MSASYICRRYVLNDDELSATFDLLDMDKDGKLKRADIITLLRTIKVEPTKRDVDSIFSEMDSEKCGLIKKEAFMQYMRSPLINRITVGELEEQFRHFDHDGDGSVNEEELEQILAKTANLHDKDCVKEMFQTVDTDGDGRINFSEFIKMVAE